MRTITVLSLLFPLATAALAQGQGQGSFFAANGNDSNPCTQTAPCLTLGKASSLAYQPGSTINFRGGDRFAGEFHLTRDQVPSGGDPSNPIIIQSYGSGRATIVSNQGGVSSGGLGPKNWALLVDSTSGVVVQDLNVTANGFVVQYGIIIQNRAATNTIGNIVVQRVDVGGFNIQGPVNPGEGGIQLEIAGMSEAINRGVCGPIDNVQILNSKFHGNDGIASKVTEGVHTKHCGNLTNIVYRGNEVFHIGGQPDIGGGNGLFMQGVSGGLIEHNLVHHNMYNVSGCGGPVGIWAYQSNHIMIQFNEVHHMHSNHWVPGSCDFGAFDLDASVFDSVIQYNYSHDNDGPAWVSFQGDGRHIIRFNISVNDNLTGNDGGGVAILNADADWVQFYNNTVIGPAACWATGVPLPPNSVIANNICVGTTVDEFGRWFGGGKFGGGDITHADIRNNLYWLAVPGNGPVFTSNLWSPSNLWSLAQWQVNTASKDQDSLNVDPLLANLSGSDAISWDPTQHAGPQPEPSNYQLTQGSPAIGAGVNLADAPYNLDIGTRDYFGNPITSTSNIGADAGRY